RDGPGGPGIGRGELLGEGVGSDLGGDAGRSVERASAQSEKRGQSRSLARTSREAGKSHDVSSEPASARSQNEPRRPRPGRLGRRTWMSWLLGKMNSQDDKVRLFEPPEWRWAQAGDVGWWVRSEWERALLGASGLRLDEWRKEGRL